MALPVIDGSHCGLNRAALLSELPENAASSGCLILGHGTVRSACSCADSDLQSSAHATSLLSADGLLLISVNV